ncbi:WD domain, G-beta repeat domain-containing protein [Hirsutella rhossiliensis]
MDLAHRYRRPLHHDIIPQLDANGIVIQQQDDSNLVDQKRQLLQGHDSVNSVTLSSNSKHLALGTCDKTQISLLESRNCQQILAGHRKTVKTVTFSLHMDILASASYDKTIRIWPLEAGDVPLVTFSTDFNLLASFSVDLAIRVWSVESGECRQIFSLGSMIYDMSFNWDNITLHMTTSLLLLDSSPYPENHAVSDSAHDTDAVTTTLMSNIHPGYDFNSKTPWITYRRQSVLWLNFCRQLPGAASSVLSHLKGTWFVELWLEF